MHQMKESEKENTSIEMENFPKSTGITSNPNDVVIEMPDDSEELQSVSIETLEQVLKTALDTMQSKLDACKKQNEQFFTNPPEIAENKEKKKKGILKKTAAFFKADDYTHFDLSIEKRKLLTPEVIQEALQKDLDLLKSEISSHLPRYSRDSSKKLEKLNRDIEKLEMFLNSSDIALDLEVRKSKGELTKKESAKSLIQGKEHMRSIVSRSFLQSLLSAGAGSVSQVGAAYLKELAFKALINQLTVKQADDVVEDYLEGLTEASRPEVTTANTPEMISDEALTPEMISDEALTNVTNAITTSEPAKFSEDICESLLAHIESLEELPDTVDELKELANNFLKGEIERLGNERSFSHNFIQTMKDCVDFSTEIERIVRPDSPYYDTAGLDYGTIVGGDFAIAMLKGCVVPVFDTLYERGKDNRETTQISSQKKNIGKFKKFRQEALLSLKNQAKGTAATLALVFAIKGASGQLTFDGVGKDITFNALQVATNGCIDGVRSLSSCGETCSQITKATLRTLIGRGTPQVVKSYISRRNEFGATGIAVTTDLAGVLLGGALKEVNGALWQRSTNNPDGNLSSWAGKAAFDERVLLKALKKRAGSNPTVLNSLKEIGKVKIRVAESDTYINQVDASLTQVISVPSVSQKPPSSGAGPLNSAHSNPVKGATSVAAGATSVAARATGVTAGATSAAAETPTLQSLNEQQRGLDSRIEQIETTMNDSKTSDLDRKLLKQKKKVLEPERAKIRQQRERILSSPSRSNKIVTTAEVHPTRKIDVTKFKSSSITPNPNVARPKQSPKQSPKQRTTKL
jgi:hypothetical protein